MKKTDSCLAYSTSSLGEPLLTYIPKQLTWDQAQFQQFPYILSYVIAPCPPEGYLEIKAKRKLSLISGY